MEDFFITFTHNGHEARAYEVITGTGKNWGRNQLENLGVDEKIILKCASKKLGVRISTVSIN